MDPRKNKTKKSIQNALLELIQEKDYSKITVTELTKKANVGRKTFYLHYENVASVVEDMESQYTETLISRINSSIITKTDCDLKNVFFELNRVIRNYSPLLRKLVKDDSRPLFHECAKRIIKAAILLYLRKGYIVDENIIEYYSEFYASGIVDLYIVWLSSSKSIPISEITEIANKVCFIGADRLLSNKTI